MLSRQNTGVITIQTFLNVVSFNILPSKKEGNIIKSIEKSAYSSKIFIYDLF